MLRRTTLIHSAASPGRPKTWRRLTNVEFRRWATTLRLMSAVALATVASASGTLAATPATPAARSPGTAGAPSEPPAPTSSPAPDPAPLANPSDPANEPAPTVANARALLDAGRVDDAQRMLLILDGLTRDAEVDRLLAETYYRQQDWPAARKYLRRTIRLDETAQDCFRLGRAYLHEGQCALAVEQLHRARRLGMTSCDLHLALAEAYQCLHQTFGQLRTVTAPGAAPGTFHDDLLLIERIKPESSKLAHQTAGASDRSHAAEGDPAIFLAAEEDTAIAQLAHATAGGCDSAAVRLLEARVWLRGRWYRHAADLFAAIERMPEVADWPAERRAALYADFAEALFGLDDLEGYVARLQQALRLDRERYGQSLARSYLRVAQRYTQRGDLARTIQYLERAVAEAPRNADLRYRLGNANWEAGELLSAAREWRIVLQLAPDHPDRPRLLDLIRMIRAEYEDSQPGD